MPYQLSLSYSILYTESVSRLLCSCNIVKQVMVQLKHVKVGMHEQRPS